MGVAFIVSSSSDEEMDDIPGIDIGKLPTIAKDDATVKRKLEKAKRKPVRLAIVSLDDAVGHSIHARLHAYRQETEVCSTSAVYLMGSTRTR